MNKFYGLLPLFIFSLLIALMVAADMRGGPVFNPPYLVLVLNTLFLTGTSIAVAYISAKSYLVEGSFNVLFLGSGVLVIGLSAFIAGWVADSPDHNVTIFNVGVLISSIAHLLSVFVTWFGAKSVESSKRKSKLIMAYLAAAVSVVIIAILAINNYMPVFFSETGPTLIRQMVLSFSILFFFLSSSFFGWLYLKSKSPVLYWYSLALMLFAVGLLNAMLYLEFNGILNWVGRLATYVSGFYFLAALWSAGSR